MYSPDFASPATRNVRGEEKPLIDESVTKSPIIISFASAYLSESQILSVAVSSYSSPLVTLKKETSLFSVTVSATRDVFFVSAAVFNVSPFTCDTSAFTDKKRLAALTPSIFLIFSSSSEEKLAATSEADESSESALLL